MDDFDFDPYNLDAYNSDSYDATVSTGDIFDEYGNFNAEFLFPHQPPATAMVQGESTSLAFDSEMGFAPESVHQPSVPQNPAPAPDPVFGRTTIPDQMNSTVRFKQSDWYFQPLQDIIFPKVDGKGDVGSTTQDIWLASNFDFTPEIPGMENPPSQLPIFLSEFVLKEDRSSPKFFTTYHMCKSSTSRFKSVSLSNSVALYEVYRSRAMLFLSVGLLPHSVDRIRILRWSDLGLQTVTFADGQTVPSLVLNVEYDVPNSDGTLPVHGPGAVRHRWAEGCTIGALGFYIYCHFHVLEKPWPNFLPDFSDPTRPYGKRDWWDLPLFSSESDGKYHMTNHRFNKIMRHYCTGISGPKSELEQRSVIENWELYNLERYLLRPPMDLLKYLFPWVEEEISAYHQRLETLGPKATDLSLAGFLTLILYLREVIIQDAVVLFLKYPSNPMFNMAPFSFSLFRMYAEASREFLLADRPTNPPAKPISTMTAYEMLQVLEDIDQNAEEIRPSLAQLVAKSVPPPEGQENSAPHKNLKPIIKRSSNKKDDDIHPPFTAQFFTNLI